MVRWAEGLPRAELAVACLCTPQDRKSTRLNSSHLVISYAVFCLKKKKYMLASINMLILSNLQSIIAHMPQNIPLSDMSYNANNNLDKSVITTAYLRITSNRSHCG